MIIELKVARSWQVWIDGIVPGHTWAVGEGEEVEGSGNHAETYYRYTTAELDGSPLIFADHPKGVRLEWIAFDIPNDEWATDIDRTRIGPTEAWVKFAGEEPIHMNVTECWYLGEFDAGPAPKGVQLSNGVWLEIDEVTAYVRLETEDEG